MIGSGCASCFGNHRTPGLTSCPPDRIVSWPVVRRERGEQHQLCDALPHPGRRFDPATLAPRRLGLPRQCVPPHLLPCMLAQNLCWSCWLPGGNLVTCALVPVGCSWRVMILWPPRARRSAGAGQPRLQDRRLLQRLRPAHRGPIAVRHVGHRLRAARALRRPHQQVRPCKTASQTSAAEVGCGLTWRCWGAARCSIGSG